VLWLYRFLFVPALIALAPGYLLRMRKRGGYGENFGQRFGAVPLLPERSPHRPRVWLQAVSVGEMLAVAPILEALHRDGVEVYLTTTTSTGYRVAHERYRGWVSAIGYFPIDWAPFVARAWRRIQPDLLILTEGERWPEHLHQAAQRGVGVIAVNARLSDRSFARLRKLGAARRLLFGGVTRLLPASAEDESRFRQLGVPRDRIATTGNIKLDLNIPLLAAGEQSALRRSLGLPDGLLLLGSSTWPGEESVLLSALKRVRAAGLRCALLIVPRHAERRADIERELKESGFRFHLRSRGEAAGEVDVTLADTTGELRRLTQLADLVFVGKSLPPHTEGQTPVEAAALQKPILFGPGMSNFRAIVRDLLARGAARQVADAAELASACEELLREEKKRAELASAAAKWRMENAGAVERTLAIIRDELGRTQL